MRLLKTKSARCEEDATGYAFPDPGIGLYAAEFDLGKEPLDYFGMTRTA